MLLSENDYINVGAGHLYGPPFLSRFLLYRFFDCNQAILIHHGETGVVSASSHGNMTTMVATEIPTTVIYSHCCFESASVSVKELLKLPSVEIPMPRNAPIFQKFNKLTLRLEEFNLSLTEKMMFARENLPRQTLKLRKSDYQVTGPVNVSFWPEKVLSSNLTFRCVKLSVAKSNTETDYNIQSDHDWGLTALDMEEDGQAPFEVNLERVAPQKV